MSDDSRPLLAPDEVHVWTLDPTRVADALLDRYASLLSGAERARHAKYAFESNRREYLLTRALARTVLARYTGADPASLAFTEGERGRPELVQPDGPRLRFNLSNTKGLVACAVTWDVDVGLDVEHLGRTLNLHQVARASFSKDELAGLLALAEGAQRERFFTLWTLKEAYIKARGLGLALPLEAFSFSLDGAAPSVRFDPPIADDAFAWQFALAAPTSDHLAGIALKPGPAAARRIRWFDTIPLASTTEP